MGLELKRSKKRVFLVTFIYRIQQLLPISKKKKFRLFIRLEWIFDRLAHEKSFQFYDSEIHPFRKFSFKFMDDHIPKKASILDLGSKFGDISYHLAKNANVVVGVDHDLIAINKAKSLFKADNLEFIQADAFEYLQKNNLKFDVLILSHILEHLDNREQFLNQFKSFFQYIYIEVPDFDKTYLNYYRKDLGEELNYTDNDHVIEFDREELIDLLMRCGIKILNSDFRFGMQKLWCEVKN